MAMSGKLSRRQFVQRGFLAALQAGLASCANRQRLAEIAPIGSPGEATSPPDTTSTPVERPTSAPSTPFPEGLHEARYYRPLDDNWIQCQMCFRQCTVPEGGRGFCRNKVNVGGRYYTLVYGRPSALQIDPIEKEPAFHMLPGATIFCTGTASCNNRCKFCHNWHLSQRSFEEIDHVAITPEQTVELARGIGYDADAPSVRVVGGPSTPDELGREPRCDAVSFTYNEPTVFYEHMFDVARTAKQAGLRALCHTNGGMNEAPLAALLEYVDAVTVDLKAFTSEFYRQVSSSELEPVLRTLQQIHRSGTHLEIVNLVVTTLNDDMDDIRRMCQWIRDTLSPEVPFHLNRFHPAYKLTSLPPTPIETLEQAAHIADEEGLQYVYIGNCPGHERNSTFCPACGERIITRIHFALLSLDVERGKCRFCGREIPGIWWDV
jgi:pyruvate formate lyase activating enzyme